MPTLAVFQLYRGIFREFFFLRQQNYRKWKWRYFINKKEHSCITYNIYI